MQIVNALWRFTRRPFRSLTLSLSLSLLVCVCVGAAENVELQSHGGGAAAVRSRLFSKAKTKSLCMTAVIVAAFIVCWTPYQVVFIIHTFIDMDNVEHRNVLWIFFFGMANSMVNPLIYGAFHSCRCSGSRTSSAAAVVAAVPQPRSVDYSSLFTSEKTSTLIIIEPKLNTMSIQCRCECNSCVNWTHWLRATTLECYMFMFLVMPV